MLILYYFFMMLFKLMIHVKHARHYFKDEMKQIIFIIYININDYDTKFQIQANQIQLYNISNK